MKKRLNQKGFTLVELAIVMVIIGLLIGAVLKGQAMIDDARAKRFFNDLQGVNAAYFSYYDKYNALPGDDNRANARWGVTNGNSNGLIAGAEATVSWQGLRYAGLISGDPATSGAAALPKTPYNGTYGFASGVIAGLGTKNYITMTVVPGSVAESVDIKYDDGVYNTGTVRASAAYSTATVTLQYML